MQTLVSPLETLLPEPAPPMGFPISAGTFARVQPDLPMRMQSQYGFDSAMMIPEDLVCRLFSPLDHVA